MCHKQRGTKMRGRRWKPWKIGKTGRITSGSHLVVGKVDSGMVWKSSKPTLSIVCYSEITVSKVRGNRLNADSRPVTVPDIVDPFQRWPNLISSVVICWSLMLPRFLQSSTRVAWLLGLLKIYETDLRDVAWFLNCLDFFNCNYPKFICKYNLTPNTLQI